MAANYFEKYTKATPEVEPATQAPVTGSTNYFDKYNSTPLTEEDQPKPEQGNLATDVLKSVARGAAGIPEALAEPVQTVAGGAGKLLDIAAGETAEVGPAEAGVAEYGGLMRDATTRKLKKAAAEALPYSTATQASQEEFGKQLADIQANKEMGLPERIYESGKAAITHPRAAIPSIGESGTQFLAGGAAGKALGLGASAYKQAVGINALLEGGGGSEGAREEIAKTPVEELRNAPRFQELESQYGTDRALKIAQELAGSAAFTPSAIGGGAATALTGGGAGGRLLESAFGTGARETIQPGLKGIARYAAKEVPKYMAKEIPEETIQGVTGQLGQNIAAQPYTGVPLTEGLVEQGVASGLQGAIGGGVYGGAGVGTDIARTTLERRRDAAGAIDEGSVDTTGTGTALLGADGSVIPAGTTGTGTGGAGGGQAQGGVDSTGATQTGTGTTAAQGAATIISDQDAKDLISNANNRLNELNRKANGTEDQVITDPVSGKPINIKGEPSQALTGVERQERDFLNTNANNPEELAKIYKKAAPPTRAQQVTTDLTNTLTAAIATNPTTGVTSKAALAGVNSGVAAPIIDAATQDTQEAQAALEAQQDQDAQDAQALSTQRDEDIPAEIFTGSTIDGKKPEKVSFLDDKLNQYDFAIDDLLIQKKQAVESGTAPPVANLGRLRSIAKDLGAPYLKANEGDLIHNIKIRLEQLRNIQKETTENGLKETTTTTTESQPATPGAGTIEQAPPPMGEAEGETVTPPTGAATTTGLTSYDESKDTTANYPEGQEDQREEEQKVAPVEHLVNDVKINLDRLTPTQRAEWDAANEKNKMELEYADRTFRDTQDKNKFLKGAGQRLSAERRRITGLHTAKEQLAKVAFANKIREGASLQTKDGEQVTAVTKPAYGRIRVKSASGVESWIATSDIKVTPVKVPKAETITLPDGTLEFVGYKTEEKVSEEEKAPITKAAEQQQTPDEKAIEAGKAYPTNGADFQGIHVAIENPAGSFRSGVDAKGNKWEIQLKDNYGSMPNVKGADKDHLDVFTPVGLSEEQEAKTKYAYVVDQYVIDDNGKQTNQFDEHKVMLGYPSLNAAKDAYLRNYNPGWSGLGAITAIPMVDLQNKINTVWDKPIKPKKVRKAKAAFYAQPTGLEELQGAIKKLGGIRDANGPKSAFYDYRGKRYQAIFNNGTNALTMDDMATSLNQYGYDIDGENGLSELLYDSLRGNEYYSPAGYENLMAIQEKENFNDEQARQLQKYEDAVEEGLIDSTDFDDAIEYTEDNFNYGDVVTGEDLNDFWGFNDEYDERTDVGGIEGGEEAAGGEAEEVTPYTPGEPLLKTYTQEEILDQQNEAKRLAAEKAAAEKAAAEKAQADREVDTLQDEMLGFGGTTTTGLFDEEGIKDLGRAEPVQKTEIAPRLSKAQLADRLFSAVMFYLKSHPSSDGASYRALAKAAKTNQKAAEVFSFVKSVNANFIKLDKADWQTADAELTKQLESLPDDLSKEYERILGAGLTAVDFEQSIKDMQEQLTPAEIKEFVTETKPAIDALTDAKQIENKPLFSRQEQRILGESRKDMAHKDVLARVPELAEHAKKMREADYITEEMRAEHQRLVDLYKPVEPYETVPEPVPEEQAKFALANGKGQSEKKAAKYGLPAAFFKLGDWVQFRLDIPSYSQNNTWINSIHTPKSMTGTDASFKAGPVVGYESASAATNVKFGVGQDDSLDIATGKAKGTIATILGQWKPMSNEEMYERAQAIVNETAPDYAQWTQVGMDPERHSYFYDRVNQDVVESADEVIQIGPLVLAKNVVFGEKNLPNRYSRQEAKNVNTFANAKEAENELIDQFGPGIANLINTKVLNLTQGRDAWPESARKAAEGFFTEAVYLNGKVYIDLQSTAIYRIKAVVLHELGEHFNLERMLGLKGYVDLQNQIRNQSRVEGSETQRVWNQVKNLYPDIDEGSKGFISEVIAKLGENNPNLPWYRRLIAKIKAFLMERGLARGFITGTLTDADMHELLVASLKSAIHGRTLNKAWVFGKTPAMASLKGVKKEKLLAPNGKPSNLNAVQHAQVRTPEFVKWFGNWLNDPENASKIIDENGEPKVVFHKGSWTRGDAKMDGYHLGVHFGTAKAAREVHGETKLGATTPVFLNIKNPAYTSDLGFGANDYVAGKMYKEGLLNKNELTEIQDLYMSQFGLTGIEQEIKREEAEGKIIKVYNKALENKDIDGIVYTNNHEDEGSISYIATAPNQIKSAIGNRGTFSSLTGDILFSRPAPAAGTEGSAQYQQQYREWSAIISEGFDKLSSQVASNKLAFFSVEQLVENCKKYLPAAYKYEKYRRLRTGLQTHWVLEGDKVSALTHNVLTKTQHGELTGVVQDSTIIDVDASKAWTGVKKMPATDIEGEHYLAFTQAKFNDTYTNQIIDFANQLNDQHEIKTIQPITFFNGNANFSTLEDAQNFERFLKAQELRYAAFTGVSYVNPNTERHAKHPGLVARYNVMPQASKDFYVQSPAIMNMIADAKQDELEDQVKEAILDGNRRVEMIKLLRLHYESNRLSQLYAPLNRYGKFWFWGKFTDGSKLYRHFETEKARNIALEQFKKVNGEDSIIADGKSFNTDLMMGGMSDNFILQINTLISGAGLDEDISEKLRDEIYQMYISLLPEVSLRHSAQHRKGTKGHEEDAERNFANHMAHAASQFSNMKWGKKMEQSIKQLRDIITMATAPYRQQDGLRKIEAAKLLLGNWEELSEPGVLEAQITAAESTPEVVLLREVRKIRNKYKSLDALNNAIESGRSMYDEVSDEAFQMLSDDWDNLITRGMVDPLADKIKRAKLTDKAKLLKAAKDIRNSFGKMEEQDAIEALYLVMDKTQQIYDGSKLLNTSEKRVKAVDIVDELEKSFIATVNSDTSPMDKFAAWARQVGFLWNLGASISGTITNVIQTPGAAMPVALGKHEFKDVIREFNHAYAEFIASVRSGKYDENGNASISPIMQERLNKMTEFSPEWMELKGEIDALESFKQDGTISGTQTMDIIGIGKEGYQHGGKLGDFSKKMGWMFHHAERLNREVTLTACYRLARAEAIKKGNLVGDSRNETTSNWAEAVEYARYVTSRSHLNYAPDNAARIFRGWPAAIALQFKKYQQGMLYLWGRTLADKLNGWKDMPDGTQEEKEAKAAAKLESQQAGRTFAALLTMQMSFAGALGLPLVGALTTTLNGLVNAITDPDEPWDWRKEVRVGLTDLMGEFFATAATKGLFNAFSTIGIPLGDMAGRMSLADTILREPIEDLEGRDIITNYLGSIAGPFGGLIGDIVEGYKLVGEGSYARGFETASPKVIGDVFKSVRFMSEGASSINGAQLKEMSFMEIFEQLAGFGSAELEQKYAERGYYKEAEKSILSKRQKILHAAAKARREGDTSQQEEVDKWNDRHPLKPITNQNISASINATKQGEKKRGVRGYTTDPDLELTFDLQDYDEE